MLIDFSSKKDELTVIVSYPEALEEKIPSQKNIKSSILKFEKGQEISHDKTIDELISKGFEKVDFVSSPGQFAIRGSIIDIFSFSNNLPYRLSFWGNEIEKINIFNCIFIYCR